MIPGPVDTPPPVGPGWTKRRVVFLGVSGVVFVSLVVWTAEVLLPFILAAITAYVLTPLVMLCERARIPRWVSILVVYAATGSVIYFALAVTAPRIYAETIQLSRETPALARELAAKWGPLIENRVQTFLDRVGPPDPPSDEPKAAFQIIEEPDGTHSVRLGSGVDLVQQGPKHWRLLPTQRQAQEFSVANLVSDGIEETVSYIKKNAFELIRVGQVILSKVTRAVFLTFMTLMVAGYLMHTRDEIVEFLRSLPPPRARPSFDRLLFRIDRGFAGVVRGQLVVMLINGVLSAIGFWLFGLKYWPILALVAGIMSIIPIFGSILSTIPAVLVALTQDFWTALWVLLWIIGIHQVEANLLNPKIIGVAAKLHPVLVVFSLIVGEHFFGLWGALLAVPALSLLQSLFNHFRYESLPDAAPDSIVLEGPETVPPSPGSTSSPGL